MKGLFFKNVKDNAMRADTFYPMSDARKDMVAYTYSYHIPGESNEGTDPFWENIKILQLLLTHCFDHHEWNHRCSCFKKGCKCWFLFPFPSSIETLIHEDFGNDNENFTSWTHIDGSEHKHIAPWIIVPEKARVPLYQCSEYHHLRGFELQQ